MQKRTWEISDIDGSNKRRVTLEQFRAELADRAVYARRVMDAVKAGDMDACAKAQADMAARFA